MITTEDVGKATGLTKPGVLYRLKQMNKSGCGIEVRYKQGKVGAIRVYTDDDLQAIINYKARKPGRKRKS